MKRREFLAVANASAFLASGLVVCGRQAHAHEVVQSKDPWQAASAIAKRLSQPLNFPNVDFVVTRFGAKPCDLISVMGLISHHEQALQNAPAPGSFDCYAAFNQAIQTCHQAGGGRVVIPAGDWFCAGPIVMLSNVHVHLAAGAQVFFSNRPQDYAKYGNVDCGPQGYLVKSRWQGNDCLNFSSMIYAHGQQHIALTGEDHTSILNGQGGMPMGPGQGAWWSWKGHGDLTENQPFCDSPNPLNAHRLEALAPNLPDDQKTLILGPGRRWMADEFFLPALSEAGVSPEQRVFGLGHFLRPSMIHLLDCKDVLLQGYQVTNTPFWQHHPVNCHRLVMRGVHANSLGPNSDGFDPESCTDVLVEDCLFDTGDDCIAIKSGKDLDTQFGPTRDVVIQNCTMHSGHGAVTLGSEMAAGIENVYVQDILMENSHWQTNPLNTAIRLKTNMNRGGYLRHFYVRRVQLPHGVHTKPSSYSPLPGSPLSIQSVASEKGAVVTFDCDYAPTKDTVRTRRPKVSEVHISQVQVSDVLKDGVRASCYQAFVMLGPVPTSFNGKLEEGEIFPIQKVTLTDCDFGHPANTKQPYFLFNAKEVQLTRVRIGEQLLSTQLSA